MWQKSDIKYLHHDSNMWQSPMTTLTHQGIQLHLNLYVPALGNLHRARALQYTLVWPLSLSVVTCSVAYCHDPPCIRATGPTKSVLLIISIITIKVYLCHRNNLFTYRFKAANIDTSHNPHWWEPCALDPLDNNDMDFRLGISLSAKKKCFQQKSHFGKWTRHKIGSLDKNPRFKSHAKSNDKDSIVIQST